jgi:hypothetical protein
MQLADTFTIDELVTLSRIQFDKRANAPSIAWIPSRQNVYSSLCDSFSNKLMIACDGLSESRLLSINMNPSQFIKASQDFQLAARKANVSQNNVLKYFLLFGNMGRALRNYRTKQILNDFNKFSFESCAGIAKEVGALNALLRALSETLYFDDHTIGGDLYSIILDDGSQAITRVYNRLRPVEIHRNILNDYNIEKIETICMYETQCIEVDDLGNLVYNGQVPKIDRYYVRATMSNENIQDVRDVEGINKLSSILEKKLKDVITHYKSLNDSQKQELVLRSTLFGFKPIFENADIDWEPTQDEKNKYFSLIQTKSLFAITQCKAALDKKHLVDDEINRIIDPRIQLI